MSTEDLQTEDLKNLIEDGEKVDGLTSNVEEPQSQARSSVNAVEIEKIEIQGLEVCFFFIKLI